MPTASAVVADLIDTVVGRTQMTFPRLEIWRDPAPYVIQPRERITCRFFLRFNVLDRPHTLADIADILGHNNISIASVIQHEAPESGAGENGAKGVVPLVIMTHRTTTGNLQAAEAELARLDSITPPHVRMPVAD
jgi:homoserine dehydrogenase